MEYAQVTVLTMLVMFQIFYVANCRMAQECGYPDADVWDIIRNKNETEY